jgi:hypothetical protein
LVLVVLMMLMLMWLELRPIWGIRGFGLGFLKCSWIGNPALFADCLG